jgi:CubicO group peptidase (beta-lactamase class C family)
MSSAWLERITMTFEKEVAAMRLSGAVAMVSRKGHVVYVHTFGARDSKTGDPMRVDSIFRVYSMTKTFVAVDAMILLEDVVVQLSDPVAKWLAAFKESKVSTPSGDLPPEHLLVTEFTAQGP